MSRRPSPSKSNRAAPDPMLWGMKWPPTGPASWTKSRPTRSVTSSNQGGPGGSSSVGAGGEDPQPRPSSSTAPQVSRRSGFIPGESSGPRGGAAGFRRGLLLRDGPLAHVDDDVLAVRRHVNFHRALRPGELPPEPVHLRPLAGV